MDTKNVSQNTTLPAIDNSKKEEFPIKPNDSKKILVLVVLIVILLLTGIGVYILPLRSSKRLTQNNLKNVVTPSITATSTPSPTTNDMQSSTFVFERNATGGIMLVQGVNASPVLVDNSGILPSYSSTLQKIAFVNSDNGKYNAVYIYDVKTKQTQEMKETVGSGTLGGVLWSPDGKYLVTLEITNTDVVTVYAYPSGSKLTSFQSYINDPHLYFDTKMDLIFRDPQPVPTPGGGGIAKILLPSGQKQVLLQLDNNYDYELMGVSGNTIYYIQMNPNSPVSATPTPRSCFQIDTDGQNKQSLDCKSVPSQQITDTVSNHLPSSLSRYSAVHCTPNPHNPTLFVCDFFEDNATNFNNLWKVGVFNKAQPQAGITSIFEGEGSSW